MENMQADRPLSDAEKLYKQGEIDQVTLRQLGANEDEISSFWESAYGTPTYYAEEVESTLRTISSRIGKTVLEIRGEINRAREADSVSEKTSE